MVSTLRQAIEAMTRGGSKIANQDATLAAYGDSRVEGPFFVTGEDGHLFVHCSGQAVLNFRPVDAVGRLQFYLVVDDRASWGWKSAAESGPKPADVLRLVASA